MRKALVWLCLVLLAILLASCGRQAGTGLRSGGHADKVKIAIVAPGASDFWTIVSTGAKKASKEFKADCEVRMPSNPGAAEQKSIVEDLLAKGIDGLAIAPIDPANQVDMINNAAAQTRVLCTDTDAPTSKRLCYIGTNNYEAGKIAGEQLKKVLPNGGKVWVCVGMLDAQNAADRNKGVQDAVKGTKIKIIGVLTDNADRVKAKANVEDALVKYPDIAGFVGLWSYNGPAIADAVRAAHKEGKVKIICFDEDAATLQAVKDGVIQATVVQRPFEFGYQSVRVLAALARGQDAGIPENKTIDTGTQVIDKTSVDKFEADLNKTPGRK